MNLFSKLFVLLFLFPIVVMGQKTSVSFEECKAFHPSLKDTEGLVWGRLTVPENWDIPNGKKVKLAVTVLEKTSKEAPENPLVYLEGGPGGGSIGGIMMWLNHPARVKSDIVLVDLRGTGFSDPNLCPGLGKKILEILAKDQTAQEDELQKAEAALECKQDMISRGVDVRTYNSQSISKDLHALKEALNYKRWNVYGVSYGTEMAQVYGEYFPEDIKSLILDSSIPEINQYYTRNTSNYMGSLYRIFSSCKEDPTCNQLYPDLEETYYATIEALEKNPVTVEVADDIVSEGQFTYNAEDFKVAIQQGLYDKWLIEVIPLLITEFHNRNENTLSALVKAFSSALTLDYGMYYCVTCNDVIPNNSMAAYLADAAKYDRLKGGLSFYKSDFIVCEKWNAELEPLTQSMDTVQSTPLNAPILVFAGGYDPITPRTNGEMITNQYENSFLIHAPKYGHAPSISNAGAAMVNEFINKPDQKPENAKFAPGEELNFVQAVKMNGGVSNFANNLQEFNMIFFAPLIVAFIVLLLAFLTYLFVVFRRRTDTNVNKGMKFLIIGMSALGVIAVGGLAMAILKTVSRNFYILAFGLPTNMGFLFIIQMLFVGLLGITILYFLLRIRRISNPTMITTILFSGLVISVYFYYWGFIF